MEDVEGSKNKHTVNAKTQVPGQQDHALLREIKIIINRIDHIHSFFPNSHTKIQSFKLFDYDSSHP